MCKDPISQYIYIHRTEVEEISRYIIQPSIQFTIVALAYAVGNQRIKAWLISVLVHDFSEVSLKKKQYGQNL